MLLKLAAVIAGLWRALVFAAGFPGLSPRYLTRREDLPLVAAFVIYPLSLYHEAAAG